MCAATTATWAGVGRALSANVRGQADASIKTGVGRVLNPSPMVVLSGPPPATFGPVMRIELDRVEALDLLAMTLAHLNDAEARAEVSPRVPLLMAVRDKLAQALREET